MRNPHKQQSLRQRHTLHNLFHYLSLFGGAGLTHNLEFGSCSLHIKRLIEKQIAKIKSSAGVSSGQHASVSNTHRITFTHTHTSTLTASIMAMQIMRQALCAEGTLVFIPACGQSIKEKVVGHPSCFAALLKQHTGNQTHIHTHMPSSVTIALFL